MNDLTPNQIQELLSYLPNSLDYQTWLVVISGVGNVLNNDSLAESILTEKYPDIKTNETKLKLKHRLKEINAGSLIHLARLHGFKEFTNESKPFKQYDKPVNKVINNYIETFKPLEVTPSVEGAIYRFNNDIEERAGLLEEQNNIERWRVDLALKEYGFECERLFRVAVNYKGYDKGLNCKTGKLDWVTFNNFFENVSVTETELKNLIIAGHPIVACKLKTNSDGTCIRKTDSFLGSELIFLDIDGGLSIREFLKTETSQKMLFLYTTSRHTKELNRFRVIIPLDNFITDKEQYKNIKVQYYDSLQVSEGTKSDIVKINSCYKNTTIVFSTGKYEIYKNSIKILESNI